MLGNRVSIKPTKLHKKKTTKKQKQKKKTRDFYEATNRALVQVTLTAHDFNRDK